MATSGVVTVQYTNVRRSPSPNHVRDYLNKPHSRVSVKDLPPLPEALLKQARNCIIHTANNNDLLEFVGDRLVNLFAASLVDKMKLNTAHHSAVRQTVCTNNTLGRIAYTLRLHTHALVPPSDLQAIEDWNPLEARHPPKCLADLFESYVGAVYVHHGWPRLQQWLDKLFFPIVKAATTDYWFSVSPEQLEGGYNVRNPKHRLDFVDPVSQGRLLDYVEFKRESLKTGARIALDRLPKGTKFRFDVGTDRLQEPDGEKVVVAVHLIEMWICQIVIRQWPEYLAARAKAPRFLTLITQLVISDPIMAYLCTVLKLGDLYALVEVDDTRSTSSSETDHSDASHFISVAWKPPTPAHLAVMFKAMVGWSYHQDPEATMTWGEGWLKPIVLKAHDVLLEQCGTRLLPHLVFAVNKSEEDPAVAALSSLMSNTLHIKTSTTKKGQPASSLSAVFDKQDQNTLPPSSADSQSKKADTMAHRTKARIQIIMPSTVVASNPDNVTRTSDPADKLAEELASLALSSTKGTQELQPKPSRNEIHRGTASTKPEQNSGGNKWKPFGEDADVKPLTRTAGLGDVQAGKENAGPEVSTEPPEKRKPHASKLELTKTRTTQDPPKSKPPTPAPLQPLSDNSNAAAKGVRAQIGNVSKDPGSGTVQTTTAFLPRSVRAKAKQQPQAQGDVRGRCGY
ncbi:hypothetical protein BXZ70DRAFT_74637 [Cristinia sonorae]|uniref:RNase III domain-containing protein n=1 Tax=Cristinia sonorae TaxID=1940300 RepID=A0A8K0URQ0_9AGAR|nr:hypothetical protein BXZ70DRAFT_74637 [Cristinia sonorae]